MARGCNKLFKDINAVIVQKHRRGRSLVFNDKRNECLMDRYLFYQITTRNHYDAIIDDLSNDFFLSPVTITNVLTLNYEGVATRKKQYSAYSVIKLRDSFKKKWGQYTW